MPSVRVRVYVTGIGAKQSREDGGEYIRVHNVVKRV